MGPRLPWPQTVLQRHRVATMGLALRDKGRRARYARLPEGGRPCGPHLFCSPGPRCVSTLDPRGPVPRLAWVPRGSPAGPAFPSWSWAPDSRPLLAPCTRSSPRMPALGAPTSPRPRVPICRAPGMSPQWAPPTSLLCLQHQHFLGSSELSVFQMFLGSSSILCRFCHCLLSPTLRTWPGH